MLDERAVSEPAEPRFSLNESQAQAAGYEGGPQIVLAGPGTGKTRVIVARVVDLLTRRGVEPESVLAVTFTNKAAGELRERLEKQTDPDLADRIGTSTFHRFGYTVLRRFAAQAGLPSKIELIDSSQRRLLLERLVEDHGLFSSIASRGVSSAIDRASEAMSQMHNAAVTPERARVYVETRLSELGSDGSDEAGVERRSLEVFGEQAAMAGLFQGECGRRGWLTFDDLISRTTELINSSGLVADVVRGETRHLLVDEFQDVNAAQINLLRAMAPPAVSPDLTVVGDDDQSIYAFRGSDERSFTHFETIWQTARTVKLETSYRSSQAILDVANAVIQRAHSRFAPDKEIRRPESVEESSPVEVIRLEGDMQSGEAIATAILRMRRGELGGERAMKLSDIAVICRSNGEAQKIRAELEVEGIEAVTARAPSPLDDPGIADLLAWIQLLVDPSDSAQAQRLLTRPPIGMNAGEAMALLKAFRGLKSRERYEPNAEGDGAGTVIEYLADRDEPAVRSFVEMFEGLAVSASEDHADLTVAKIIRRTGIMGADLVGGEDHAHRVRSLAAALRFVRERTSRLEQPRDLAAFWRYYQRLEDSEQQFESVGRDVVLGEGGGIDGGEQAVHVLTAHASKGLEYGTVFVARVTSPHGFPMMDRGDEAELPVALGMNRDSQLSRVERHQDEERRVFYVACTRAMRRLVLVGKTPKTKGAKSFLKELIDAGELVKVREVRDVLLHGKARDELETEALVFKERMAARAVIDRARTEARREAALALAAAEHETGDKTSEQSLSAFERAAMKLRCIAQAERDDEVPRWAEGEASLGELVGALRAAFKGEQPTAELAPVPGPLDLSYTKIKRYRQCPRCYYVEHVLGLTERSGVAQLVGTSVHDALQEFYTRWREADSEGLETPGVEQLQTLAREAFLSAWPEDEEVDHGQLAQIRSQLDLFWERHHRGSMHITELERSVKLRWEAQGQTHTIRMKIDRVDLVEGGERIVDYKTGRPKKELVEVKKTDLQMGLYMLGLRQLRQDPELTGSCEYWVLASGEVGRIGFEEINEGKVRKAVDETISGILAGRFEPKCKGTGACSILDPE